MRFAAYHSQGAADVIDAKDCICKESRVHNNTNLKHASTQKIYHHIHRGQAIKGCDTVIMCLPVVSRITSDIPNMCTRSEKRLAS